MVEQMCASKKRKDAIKNELMIWKNKQGDMSHIYICIGLNVPYNTKKY